MARHSSLLLLLAFAAFIVSAHADCSHLAALDATTGQTVYFDFSMLANSSRPFTYQLSADRWWMWRVCGTVSCLGAYPYPAVCMKDSFGSTGPAGYWDGHSILYNRTAGTVNFILSPSYSYEPIIQVACDPYAQYPSNPYLPIGEGQNRRKPILAIKHHSACLPSPSPPIPTPSSITPSPVVSPDTSVVLKGLTFPSLFATSCSGTASPVSLHLQRNSCSNSLNFPASYRIVHCDNNYLSVLAYPGGSNCGVQPFANFTYPLASCLPDIFTESGGSFMYLGCQNAY